MIRNFLRGHCSTWMLVAACVALFGLVQASVADAVVAMQAEAESSTDAEQQPAEATTAEAASDDTAGDVAPNDDPESQAAVESGREALSTSWPVPGFNWYDEKDDKLQRINIRPPRQPSNWKWKFPNWKLPSIRWDWIAWVVVGALLLLIGYVLIRAYLQRENQDAINSTEEDAQTIAARQSILRDALPMPAREQIADLLTAARRAYEQGDMNQAIIFLYSHQLVLLDRGQRIVLARGKTNRQYLRELRGAPRLAALFEQSMIAFEDVYFGGRMLSRERFEACWNKLDEFQTLCGTSSTRSAA